MELYSAEIQHSAETIKRFTKLQYDTFEWWRKLLLLALSVILILFGLSSGSSVAMVFCLFAGCLLLTNLSFRANSVAEGVAEAMHGKYPLLHYSFSETGFTDGEDRPEVPYGSLYRLIADERYLYLFVSKASGYMLSRDSVKGEGDIAGLMALVSEKSNLSWKGPFSLLTFSLRDLLPQRSRHGS